MISRKMQPGEATLQLDKPLTGELVTRFINIPAGRTLLETLESLDFKIRQPVIAVVNGQTVDLAYRLQPGDTIRLLPQISGG
jgi:sulfur carrier protein ThiS